MTFSQALTVTRFGEPEVIRVRTSAVEEPGPDEVQVRVEASSLVFTDTLIRRNLYPVMKLTAPVVLGYDFVGRIEAVGARVSGWKIGDRIADLTQIGGAQTLLNHSAELIVAVPDSVSAISAEPLVLSYLTAWQSVIRIGGAVAGSRVLVLGASGAVGLAALDIARSIGAHVCAVASSKRRRLLESYDATVIQYDVENVSSALAAHVAHHGAFDVIFDVAGSIGYGHLASLLKPQGHLIAAGFSGMRTTTGSVGSLKRRIGIKFVAAMMRQRFSKGFRFYDISATRRARPDWYRADLAKLFALLEAGNISPLISGVYDMENAAEAHRRIEAGEVTGRLVLKLN